MRVMQDGGVIQDSGFPQDGGMANEECAKTTRTRCKHMVHLIHARASHRGRLGLYLQSVRSRAERVRCGVEEVDVLVAVVEEVVVHVSSWEVVVHMP